MYLDIIGKQHKKDAERENKEARTGFERGRNGFELHKKTESRQIREPRKGKNCLPASFQIFLVFSHRSAPSLVFHDFDQKMGKGGQNLEERERR